MRRIASTFPLLLALGCAMPQTSVRTTDSRPSLLVTGAPSASVLFVDGIAAGPADQAVAVRVEPGSHQVEVRDAGGSVVYQQRVFVESELKTIQVH